MTEMQRIAKVLRAAAHRIHSRRNRYSCYAVEAAEKRVSMFSPARQFYVEVMSSRPEGVPWIYVSDFEVFRMDGKHRLTRIEAKQHRIMALLMAAEVAEGGGL